MGSPHIKNVTTPKTVHLVALFEAFAGRKKELDGFPSSIGQSRLVERLLEMAEVGPNDHAKQRAFRQAIYDTRKIAKAAQIFNTNHAGDRIRVIRGRWEGDEKGMTLGRCRKPSNSVVFMEFEQTGLLRLGRKGNVKLFHQLEDRKLPEVELWRRAISGAGTVETINLAAVQRGIAVIEPTTAKLIPEARRLARPRRAPGHALLTGPKKFDNLKDAMLQLRVAVKQ